jgi:hypothetical protein
MKIESAFGCEGVKGIGFVGCREMEIGLSFSCAL